ncbi:hypothetical membrane protein, conserved [Thermococcus kodakarensis KOD1]|uniref:Hypothetical membrane protein, conserved n=1 Tax=Thermococcus kodakarensis (strain ATCC BAA-918 / JCM 12380 / KOD1) TaxID=69014 RepID=Q5JIW1_THEKO|nr:hypothetical protein [Thermococcus kodakarensis]WCN27581.1 hypothetical protein POG15_08420 [Thermococcus kodakarensis]WCN29872.1 hypothetical protein POG21_08410 [Thermococcus kodakarensis]BAD85842.1 hypothetical membrane protein, conserved [Thermococcus kodakarensis KOD1]
MKGKRFRALPVLFATIGVLMLVAEILMVLHARFSLPQLPAENEGRYVSFGLMIVIFFLYLPVPLSFFLLAGLLYPEKIKHLGAIAPFLTAVGVLSLTLSLLMAFRMDAVGFLSFLTFDVLSILLARKEEFRKSEKFNPLVWTLTALCVLQAALFGAVVLLS